ncbi:hypothetical protein sos41_19230 [Alphaproteobacteria bacterium SO-S41]|nr:hypothetical protein sos41_19230 [Alphaproteobacteria bacterium SO-S41]
MQVIHSVEELDQKVREIEAAYARSPHEAHALMGKFRMQPPNRGKLDPDSPAYRDAEFALYRSIAGKTYAVENEVSDFDPIAAIDRPFPYFTGDYEAIGDQLMTFGWIFKTMRLPEKRSVLEFGPGWSNLTFALAKAGLNVTAVEIEQNFITFIRERARRDGLTVEAVHGEFLTALELQRTFDAVLFFASFHHSADHGALLDALDTLIAPGGIAVFASEPFLESFSRPWGIRLDGESLWATRRYGWLELGFRESYIRANLRKRGWMLEKHRCADSPSCIVFVARRLSDIAAGLSVQTPAPTGLRTRLRSAAKAVVGQLPLPAQRAAFAMARAIRR